MKQLQFDAFKYALYANSFIDARQRGLSGLATLDEVLDFTGQGRLRD